MSLFVISCLFKLLRVSLSFRPIENKRVSRRYVKVMQIGVNYKSVVPDFYPEVLRQFHLRAFKHDT